MCGRILTIRYTYGYWESEFCPSSFVRTDLAFQVTEVYGLRRRGLKRVRACVSNFSPEEGNRTLWRSQYYKWVRFGFSLVGSLIHQILFQTF